MTKLLNWDFNADEELIVRNAETRQLLNNPLLQKDNWRTIEDLGLKVNEHQKTLSINFQGIEQDWLKILAKLYILVRSQRNLSPSGLKNNVHYLKKFSRFLQTKSISSPKQINDTLFEELSYYLNSSSLSLTSIKLQYITLKSFFDLCRQEKWLEINSYWFEGKCQRTVPQNAEIEYIPEEVWRQLDEHLHHLPEQIQRMVLVIRGTGLRIGELLNLPLDCLRQRGKQWRLRFLTEKYKTEDELPICPELVAVVQEQQEYIRNHFGKLYNNLFSSNNGHINYIPAARVMNSSTFNRWLNQLATEKKICTNDGQAWYFRSHQFRRTLATIMTNAGVRDLIIQKYLRHRSPDMQNHYKHLLKQVLGDEYRQFMKETKYVDFTGKLVAIHKPKSAITEILRRKMYQITTQYGECHRAVLKSPCQTVNACWRCEFWYTSPDNLGALKDDLQRIEAELEIAIQLGMVRQQQGLSGDQQSLKKRIQGLEEANREN